MDGSNHLLKTLLRDIEFSRQILLFLKHNDPLSFLKSRFQAYDFSHYLVNNYKNWDLALFNWDYEMLGNIIIWNDYENFFFRW